MTDTPKFKVAVLTLCYNTGGFVDQAITSLVEQSYYSEKINSIQHLILDDASSDNSVQIIKDRLKKCKHNYTFIENEVNKGISNSFDALFKLIDAEYYCFLSDDLWNPIFLTSNINLLDSLDNDVGVVYSDVQEIDENNSIISTSFFQKYNICATPSGNAYEQNIAKNFIPAISSMVRYKCAVSVGGYDINLPTEDVDFWLRLLREFKCHYNSKNLVSYRRHNKSVTISAKYDLAEFKLITYNKHWGQNSKIDKLLLKKSKRIIIYSLYKNHKSKMGLLWLDRYAKSTNTIDVHFLRLLYKTSVPLFVIKLYLRLILKLSKT